ncbi:MAG: hypothetical protein ABJM06_12240 [Gilvibacter sp.]
MKKLFLLAFVAVLFSCETESNFDDATTQETAVDKVAALLAMEANPDFDESVDGLYKGIFASYDLGIKGEIVLNMGNDLSHSAAVELVRSEGFFDEIYFIGRPHDTERDTYIYESIHGSFTAKANDQKEIIIDHFTFNGRDSYIAAFKATRGADVSMAFGTYVDDLDATYTGNWDAVNQGAVHVSPPGEHSTGPAVLLLLERVVVTRGATMIMNTDTGADNDAFFEPCFYTTVNPFPQAWWYESGDNTYREFIGYNQTTTLGGRVATWNLAYYLFGGTYTYDTPACGTPSATGYGDWSWDGRSGRLNVTTLVDL